MDNYYYKTRIAHLIPSLDLYAQMHCPTGGFLRACLENDLMEAAGRADHQNIHLLAEIACYIHNNMPGPCHGSPEKVARWIADRPEPAPGPEEVKP